MREWVAIFITTAIRTAIMIAMGFPIMLLWNAVVPDVFGVAEIDFGQAVLLLILASMLSRVSSLFDSIK